MFAYHHHCRRRRRRLSTTFSFQQPSLSTEVKTHQQKKNKRNLLIFIIRWKQTIWNIKIEENDLATKSEKIPKSKTYQLVT